MAEASFWELMDTSSDLFDYVSEHCALIFQYFLDNLLMDILHLGQYLHSPNQYKYQNAHTISTKYFFIDNAAIILIYF